MGGFQCDDWEPQLQAKLSLPASAENNFATILADEGFMLLALSSHHVGNVYVIRCVGRIVLGEEVKSLEAALEPVRNFI
jgi:hypothetical protein